MTKKTTIPRPAAEKSNRFTFTLHPALAARLHEHSRRTGVPIAETLRRLAENFLAAEATKGPEPTRV